MNTQKIYLQYVMQLLEDAQKYSKMKDSGLQDGF